MFVYVKFKVKFEIISHVKQVTSWIYYFKTALKHTFWSKFGNEREGMVIETGPIPNISCL